MLQCQRQNPLYRALERLASVSSCKFHASASQSIESHRARIARIAKEKNQAGRQRRALEIQQNKPHNVLGHPLSDDSKWQNCDLAKVLITPEKLESAPLLSPDISPDEQLVLPRYQAFGIGEPEEKLLFERLPQVSVQNSLYQSVAQQGKAKSEKYLEADRPGVIFKEMHKAHMLARLTDLRNTNADGLAFENRRRIIAVFSEPGQPNDSGRPEVQVALFTMKIRNLWQHLSSARKDKGNLRHLQRLVHRRAKMLKYLKRVDYERWRTCLDRLGLEPEAVEGELNVTV
ncbi:mitochondrial ribosomal protein S15 [Sistotremastrum suecicum HHB10207 ss-3]|uniref:Mitochondrial ribosomal protein S15 n=1 Tax=Sistotremastrum suecicum HHB10207 ss-3 TaxID=1314776 RepID=A0A166J1N9_9AGAM|nr:mitochondrial ribosomal protein S15 [Sistotremastrum suecicum HHB10207 ss-3]